MIEATVLISHGVGHECFSPLAKGVIEVFIRIQGEVVDQTENPIRTYLLNSWSKLSMLIGDELVPYLE